MDAVGSLTNWYRTIISAGAWCKCHAQAGTSGSTVPKHLRRTDTYSSCVSRDRRELCVSVHLCLGCGERRSEGKRKTKRVNLCRHAWVGFGKRPLTMYYILYSSCFQGQTVHVHERCLALGNAHVHVHSVHVQKRKLLFSCYSQ